MPEPDEGVPPLGSWPRLYAAVILSAILVMVLIGLFSYWRF